MEKRNFVGFGIVLVLLFTMVLTVGCSDDEVAKGSNDYEFTGKIQDFEGSQTKLTVQLDNKTTEVDETGAFSFKNIKAANYELKIIHEDGTIICSEQLNIKDDTFKNLDLRERILKIQEKNAKKYLVPEGEANTRYLDNDYYYGAKRKANPGEIWISLDQKTSSFRHGHAGIAVDDGETIESFPDHGVQRYHYDWDDRYKSVALVRVKGASYWNGKDAIEEAEQYIDCPYNSHFWDYKRTDKFYCSQLVWRAWYEQGHDLNFDRGIVYPEDLGIDRDETDIVYSRHIVFDDFSY